MMNFKQCRVKLKQKRTKRTKDKESCATRKLSTELLLFELSLEKTMSHRKCFYASEQPKASEIWDILNFHFPTVFINEKCFSALS